MYFKNLQDHIFNLILDSTNIYKSIQFYTVLTLYMFSVYEEGIHLI